MHRMEIDGLEFVRSSSVPDLDSPCGVNFCYRELTETLVARRISFHGATLHQ